MGHGTLADVRRDEAHKNWFFWVLFVIVVATLLTE